MLNYSAPGSLNTTVECHETESEPPAKKISSPLDDSVPGPSTKVVGFQKTYSKLYAKKRSFRREQKEQSSLLNYSAPGPSNAAVKYQKTASEEPAKKNSSLVDDSVPGPSTELVRYKKTQRKLDSKQSPFKERTSLLRIVPPKMLKKALEIEKALYGWNSGKYVLPSERPVPQKSSRKLTKPTYKELFAKSYLLKYVPQSYLNKRVRNHPAYVLGLPIEKCVPRQTSAFDYSAPGPSTEAVEYEKAESKLRAAKFSSSLNYSAPGPSNAAVKGHKTESKLPSKKVSSLKEQSADNLMPPNFKKLTFSPRYMENCGRYSVTSSGSSASALRASSTTVEPKGCKSKLPAEGFAIHAKGKALVPKYTQFNFGNTPGSSTSALGQSSKALKPQESRSKLPPEGFATGAKEGFEPSIVRKHTQFNFGNYIAGEEILIDEYNPAECYVPQAVPFYSESSGDYASEWYAMEEDNPSKGYNAEEVYTRECYTTEKVAEKVTSEPPENDEIEPSGLNTATLTPIQEIEKIMHLSSQKYSSDIADTISSDNDKHSVAVTSCQPKEVLNRVESQHKARSEDIPNGVPALPSIPACSTKMAGRPHIVYASAKGDETVPKDNKTLSN